VTAPQSDQQRIGTKQHNARVVEHFEKNYYVWIAVCLDCMWRSPAFISFDPAEEAADDHEEEALSGK
jgi:hypothetical protein